MLVYMYVAAVAALQVIQKPPLLSYSHHYNEQISQNPRRVAHCRVSSLVIWLSEIGALQLKPTCLLLLLTRRQQSADHKDKVCQVGVTVNTIR